jgi:hypothetical protein
MSHPDAQDLPFQPGAKRQGWGWWLEGVKQGSLSLLSQASKVGRETPGARLRSVTMP